MKDYILLHYKRGIAQELCRQIADGEVATGYDIDDIQVVPQVNTCRLRNMSFWRASPSSVIADIDVGIDLLLKDGVIDDTVKASFRVALHIDMDAGEILEISIYGESDVKPARDMWLLDDYLVPILRKDEIEAAAEELLGKYYPEALCDLKTHDAAVMAARMGLRVMTLPLYKRSRTKSILYFCESEIAVCQDQEEQTNKVPALVRIPENTIVINSDLVPEDSCDLDIYHECVHFDWHYLFYRLQDMHSNDVKCLKTRRTVKTAKIRGENPLLWIEWQARRGGFGLFMPAPAMRPVIRAATEEMTNRNWHLGRKMELVARKIAYENDLPKYRVRARLIQLGHVLAKGALNYVDDRYIDPFAFAVEKGTGDYTFVIDKKAAFAEYKDNPDFRAYLDSGDFIYADGHICLNDPRYIEYTRTGAKLTKWANAHVDECCLRFITVYEQYTVAEYCFGALNSDEEYNRHYLMLGDNDREQGKPLNFGEMSDIVSSLPSTFHETLVALMKMKKVTNEQLAERASMSVDTVKRLRNSDRRDYTHDQVVALCIGLHLPPWLSCELTKRAGLMLRDIPEHRAFRYILDCLFMDSIDEVQQFLKTSKFDPLNTTRSQTMS
jgi:transcriptional regulator with XRE-family HTH domain